MSSWVKKARGPIELFRRCMKNNEEDMNEAENALVDVLGTYLSDQISQVLANDGPRIAFADLRRVRKISSTKFFRSVLGSGSEVTKKTWKSLENRIDDYLSDMDATVKHLVDLVNYPKTTIAAHAGSLSLRNAPVVLSREFCAFPVDTLVRSRNIEFFGRVGELERINAYLDPRNNTKLRTYTLFGRRGVGKTDIALEFAHTNTSKFDAIFWVNCETSGALRTSFAAIATALRLPNADRAGCHEENQLAVQHWLNKTSQQWLLIFDNAESSEILKGYWPTGAKGAILITSRKYYNFANDAQRHGDTIKPFNERQSWELFMKLLGPNWQQKNNDSQIKEKEEKPAKALLQNFGGLAIAIQQAAQLVNNVSIGGPTIASTLEAFKVHQKSLPPRHIHPRSVMELALDSLWDMSFNGVTLDLFLPTNQKSLEGKLQFCRQHLSLSASDTGAALSSVISEPPLLRDAILELKRLKLIKYDKRTLGVHRVVQEAMNYHSSQEMQMYFDSAAAVVYEAFPKQLNSDILSKHWLTYENYIAHGVSLSLQFEEYHQLGDNRALKGSLQLVRLFINCAWYLCEICDYNTCLRVITSGRLACESTETLEYGKLCSIAGCAFYELNDLENCRRNFETFLLIQEKVLNDNELEKSSSLHHMGVLECASENLDLAFGYLARAIAIRISAGDEATNLLANTYLRLSRVFFNKMDYYSALESISKSEVLYLKITDGGAAPFLAHIYYAYGNIYAASGDMERARRSYIKSLGISNARTSVHPIAAAGYYSLGAVEFELKHHEKSIEYLRKALSIARLRSPVYDDGTVARILWKTAVVLKEATDSARSGEIDLLLESAERALEDPRNSGGCGHVLPRDDNGQVDETGLQEMYDSLVPEFFR
ncbi:hypothetical protein IFR05_002680 [Cadophora sp. M221]|nr:hypothetical protein IFR05_002680 [Cadophora sp. M221]